MIGLAYWSRDALCVSRDGRRQHLFNPSAFTLGVAALALVILRRLKSRTVRILRRRSALLSTLCGFPYGVCCTRLSGPVTMSSALAMVFIGWVYRVRWYCYYIDTASRSFFLA